MKIKELFTVPEGQKVTEKVFRRVLISSICSILLCMSCLVSTTWAWFTVSIENQGNEIQIVDLMVQIKQGETVIEKNTDGSYLLTAGSYSIDAVVTRAGSSAIVPEGQVPYVVMTVLDAAQQAVRYYAPEKLTATEATLTEDKMVSFAVQWVKPAEGEAIQWNAAIQAIGEVPADPSESSTPVGTTNPPAGEATGATPETTGGIPGETTVENP